MKKRIKTIFLTLLISLTANAKKDIEKDKNLKVKYKIEKIDGVQTLFLKGKDGKFIKSISADSPIYPFISLKMIYFKKKNKNFILTKWYKGAHGEAIRVLDMNGNQVFRYNSGWPAFCEVKNDALIIYASEGPVDKINQLKKTWTPN